MLNWVYFFQKSCLSTELAIIHKSRSQPVLKGPLAKLSPLLVKGLLQVGVRLDQALLDYDQKHLLILPDDCFLARLIIEDTHSRILYGGLQLTLGTIHRQYWLLNGHGAVKSIIGKSLMHQLPKTRTTPSIPFLHTGVDYARLILVWPSLDVRVLRGIYMSLCLLSDLLTKATAQTFTVIMRRIL